MLKRFIAIFSIICAGFVLGSCSDSLDRTSSVSFKLSDSFFREALNSSVSDSSAGDISDEPAATEEYIVRVTVNWDNGNRFNERNVVRNEDGKIDCPEFTFDDLPVGKTVKIDVYISCGGNTIYSMEKPFETTLKAGKNTCSVTLEKQVADVSISIENKDSLKLDSSYKLIVEITDSSNKTAKSEYPVCDGNVYKIAENKLIGETLEISVSVYNNSLCLYKTLEPHSVAVAKENNVQVTLSNAVSTAAVWQNRMSYSNSYELFQNKSYKDSQETDSLAALNYNGMYTFDGNGNLWTVTVDADTNAMNFNMYAMNSNELIYNSDFTKSYSIDLKDVSEEPVDIYWDDDTLYILFNDNDDSENPYNVKSYKIEDESFSQKSEDALTVVETDEPVTLAVHDKTIIVASKTSVYYAISESEKSGKIVDLSTKINVSNGSIPLITDLQFGDGLGNDTNKLYVLVRDCSSSISNSSTDSIYYSRGALVEIDVEDLESKKYKQYGNVAENNTVQIIDTEKNAAKDVVLESPVDDSNFFGPYKFVALAPRKLVILDDGVYVDTDNKKLTNNDNLFEFDIAEKTITKGESVSASVPDVTSMAADWKN